MLSSGPQLKDLKTLTDLQVAIQRDRKISKRPSREAPAFKIAFKITFKITFEITFKITFEITFKITFEMMLK